LKIGIHDALDHPSVIKDGVASANGGLSVKSKFLGKTVALTSENASLKNREKSSLNLVSGGEHNC